MFRRKILVLILLFVYDKDSVFELKLWGFYYIFLYRFKDSVLWLRSFWRG